MSSSFRIVDCANVDLTGSTLDTESGTGRYFPLANGPVKSAQRCPQLPEGNGDGYISYWLVPPCVDA